MDHKVRVFALDDAGKETEIFMQMMPPENLRAVIAAANQKPRKPREPRPAKPAGEAKK